MKRDKELSILLKRFAPDEYDIIGVESIDKIITSSSQDADIEVFSSSNGSDLDYSSIIATIGAIVSVIDIAIKVLEYHKESRNKRNKKELTINIIKEIPQNVDFLSSIGNDKEKVVNLLVEEYIRNEK
jgi:hypothetical protein